MVSIENVKSGIYEKAKNIKLVLTDCDGVLTDTGVYYSEKGEELKRFSIRDGMAVERLKKLVNLETGIISGEKSPSILKRAEKLGITELHLGVKDKEKILEDIMIRKKISNNNIAYIGDDVNDLNVLHKVGLSGCPVDAVLEIKNSVDYITYNKGGYGAFRDFAEFIIYSIRLEINY